MQSLVLLFFVSIISASILPPRTAPALPVAAFPKDPLIPFEDFLQGKDLPNGFNASKTHVKIHEDLEAAATVQTAAEAACSANPNVRFEWRQFSTSDKLAFIGAIKCLMNKPPSGNFPPATSRYEDLVRLHQMDVSNIHGNPKFLPWHRYYLWTFEQVLRDECGFDRAFPWWDETIDAGNFANAELFTNTNYFGHLPGPNPNGNAYCIESGAFAGLTCNIGPGTSNTPHCLARAVDESLTAQCNTNFVQYCNSRTDYADMESCAEGGPHAYGHDGIGAVMSDVAASPSDPIFWMHHSFVDHGYRIWQKADDSRLTTLDGTDHQGNPLTLNTMMSVGGIRPDVPIGDVINTLGGVSIGGVPFCYRYTY